MTYIQPTTPFTSIQSLVDRSGPAPASSGASQVCTLGRPSDQGLSASQVANTQLGNTWHDAASGAQSTNHYQALFGNQSYVKNGSDPKLLAMLTMALVKDPALQSTQLGADVQSGHVTEADIKILQQELESKGYSCGNCGVDGKYGPDTNGALEAFLNGDPPTAQGGSSQSGSCPASAQPPVTPHRRPDHRHAEPLPNNDAGPDPNPMPEVQYA